MVYNSVGYHSVCYIFLFTILSALYKTKQQNIHIKSAAPLVSRQNFLIEYFKIILVHDIYLVEWPTDRNSWLTWHIYCYQYIPSLYFHYMVWILVKNALKIKEIDLTVVNWRTVSVQDGLSLKEKRGNLALESNGSINKSNHFWKCI